MVINTGFLQVIEEFGERLVKVVRRHKIVINVGIARISCLEVRILIFVVQVIREVVSNGNKLGVEWLLQVLQVLDRVLEEQLVFQPITGGLIA